MEPAELRHLLHKSIGGLREDGQVPREGFIHHDSPAPLQVGLKANLFQYKRVTTLAIVPVVLLQIETPEVRPASEIKELLRGWII